MIVDERMVTFIHSLETENSEILETIEKEALDTYVPIIRKEMQSFLKVYFQDLPSLFSPLQKHMDTSLLGKILGFLDWEQLMKSTLELGLWLVQLRKW